MTARRAAIYARVSTGDQTCENQLLCLREVAERAGWEVVQEYVETASGASEARPELARARKDATRRRYDVLVAWDASRLARSLRVLLNLAHDLESLGIGLHLHQEAIDTTTPSGRLLFQVRGMVAELERSIIVERTKAGLARARSQGKRLGRPPASDALVAAIRNSCRDRQPEVDDAYHAGLAREHDALVGNLRAAADEGNVVANIFLLKARHQYREGEALEANLNVSLNTGGVLVVPPKMSVADFLEERRRAGSFEGPRIDAVERIPGQREPETIEGVLDPETRRSE